MALGLILRRGNTYQSSKLLSTAQLVKAQSFISNEVTLRFDDGDKFGCNFSYPTKASRPGLFFGEIIALAGDFYANWHITTSDYDEQLSDYYDKSLEKSIGLFKDLAGYLTDGVGGFLDSVLGLMGKEKNQILAVQTLGRDPVLVNVNNLSWERGQFTVPGLRINN